MMVMGISSLMYGQNSSSTSSPYSRFGFGTLSGSSFGRGDGMGGIGIGINNSFQINPANPASYTAVDSLTFLMQFGLDGKFTHSATTTASNNRNNVNFNHMTFLFPATRWWAVSFGLIPYASKGYTITATDGTSTLQSSSSFSGDGTLSKVYIGNAFNLGKHLTFGVNSYFIFGKLSDETYIYFPNDADAYDYLKQVDLSAHGFGFTGGVQYKIETTKENRLTLGATIDPKVDISSTYTIHEERALFRNSSTTSAIIDTIQHVESNEHGLQIPLSYGAGFSYNIKNKIVFGADAYYQKWKETKFLGQQVDFMTNSSRYSAGLEVCPNQYSIRSYWERTQYRLGGFYENSYLMLNGTQLKNYGVTFGLGLQLGRSRTTLNISGEIGKLGTTDNNLIRETYTKLTVFLLLHDRWFYKSKFD
ncbi:MAG: hypothetical protein LWW85_03655 [Marinilabiliales bacterium]|nr:hypothetical protein [Marinilabiliales bacterium]